MWWIVLVVALGMAASDTAFRMRHLLDLGRKYGGAVEAPAVDPQSPTGYAGGLRSLLLPYEGADTYHWVMQTQEMIARSDLRVRWVDYDNAPIGRPVHWAAPVHWWLALIAWVDRAWSGEPIGIAVEHAALVMGPLHLALVLLVLVPFVAMRFGQPAAVCLALVFSACLFVFSDFEAGGAGHNGIGILSSFIMVLGLVAGTFVDASREGVEGAADLRAARRWFAVSALAGACAIWISAAASVPALVGVGWGALLACWLNRGKAHAVIWLREPALFRFWGMIGASATLVAYAIEYFPNHMGMRLEVNHPLYSLAWLAAGELLTQWAYLWRGGNKADKIWHRLIIAAGAAVIVGCPVFVILTWRSTFLVADPLMWRLHEESIWEFQPLVSVLRTNAGTGYWTEVVPPFLLFIPALWRLAARDSAPAVKGAIALALVPAAMLLALAFLQLRWMNLATLLLVPLVGATSFGRPKSVEGQSVWTGVCLILCIAVFTPGMVGAIRRIPTIGQFTGEENKILVERDVAQWLQKRAGGERVIVATAPGVTTNLIFHGHLAGLGTLYWENLAGLKAAADLYAAPSAEAAHEIVRRLGITHVVSFSWDGFAPAYVRLARNLSPQEALPKDVFIGQLPSSLIPPVWLRRIPYPLDPERVSVWEVVPDQNAKEATIRAADYYLELGYKEMVSALVPALAGEVGDLESAALLGRIRTREGDFPAFSQMLERVVALLGQANGLSMQDRVHVVWVLALGHRISPAREQLTEILRTADLRQLRGLTPGALSDLLRLARDLQVEWPEPALRDEAYQLLPPSMRQ